MRHLIIGSGTVGYATGVWLESNNEEVIFNDINKSLLVSLLSKGHHITNNPTEANVHIIWICTHEKYVDSILSDYKNTNKIVVIRSTTLPGTIDELSSKYKIYHIAHVPEFLRESTSIDDIFNPDRVIIGTNCVDTKNKLLPLYKSISVPIICTTPVESELIKLIANSWLSTQITFWNEIYSLLTKFNVNPQEVANAVTLDKRISNYGSKMIHKPFSGMCLPKDLVSIINVFKKKKVNTTFFTSIKESNDKL